MKKASGVVFVEIRDAKGGGACRGVRRRGYAMGGGVHQGKAKKRPASRWRCFKRKYVFFPGEGFKGVGGFKVFILLESFGFLKYTREGVRKGRLQQRLRS